MGVELFLPVKAAACVTDAVLVGFSGGKDSVVTLDLCCRHFRRVVPYFYYLVPGLSYQEGMIRWAERKYGVEVVRMPHPDLSVLLKLGFYRRRDLAVPIVSFPEALHYLRVRHGIWWVAAGEKISDSLWRRAMMKKSGSIDVNRGRFFPVAHFGKRDILAYIRQKRLKMPPLYDVLGRSFGSLRPDALAIVREHYPDDFEKIKRWFPLVEVALHGRREEDEASEI